MKGENGRPETGNVRKYKKAPVGFTAAAAAMVEAGRARPRSTSGPGEDATGVERGRERERDCEGGREGGRAERRDATRRAYGRFWAGNRPDRTKTERAV